MSGFAVSSIERTAARSAPRGSIRRFVYGILACAVLLLTNAACEPEIGDECETNLDCPSGAICDLNSPGGYCLIRPCAENADCPDESVCVAFDRFTTFCLRACTSDGDCRSNYVCRDDVGPDRFCYVPPEVDAEPFGRAP